MADAFVSVHVNAADAGAADMRPRARHTLRAGAPRVPAGSFRTDEAAARFHLSDLLANDAPDSLRGLTAPDSPQLLPDLKLRDGKRSPLTRTTTVRFTQTHAAVPVLGAGAAVELGNGRNPLAVDAHLATVHGVSHLASIKEEEAMHRIAGFVSCAPDALAALPAPFKTFYWGPESQRWHLAWYMRDIPGAPPDFFEETRSHGPGSSVALRFPRIHALVDAHDGAILLYWSAYATLVRCTGIDEDGVPRKFYGSARAEGSEIELKDPLRFIRTIDLCFNEYLSPNPPADPIRHSGTDFSAHTAAVAAHFNTGLVSDFFRTVLHRDSIDDNGMEILSYINCTDRGRIAWENAAWAERKMWFGCKADANGTRRSFARHLDLIAHELTHGVVEFSADLVYRDQSGAIDESFCDIFAVLIKNWDWQARDSGGDTAAWNWSIGEGLGANGSPLRDLKDPTRTGMPDHMDAFVQGRRDHGGVHSNCNIHNKAAYNMLTARAGGSAVLTPLDCAVLYYLTLRKLSQLATFSQLRATLLNVAGTYFLGAADRQQKLDAVADAYERVGIR